MENKEKYISYKEYQKFCRENNINFDEEYLNRCNNNFIDKKLKEYKTYFDEIFGKAEYGINLDEDKLLKCIDIPIF